VLLLLLLPTQRSQYFSHFIKLNMFMSTTNFDLQGSAGGLTAGTGKRSVTTTRQEIMFHLTRRPICCGACFCLKKKKVIVKNLL
jgi:hypothetical protein